MKRKIFYSLATFVMTFLFHGIYSILSAMHISRQWVQIENVSLFSLYFKSQDFFLGFSYALAGAFVVYAFLKFIETRKNNFAGVLSGITLTGFLYISGCFLLGCCGSPMLVVYLSLFGSSFIGFTKPFIAIITIISVVIGYFQMEKKSKNCCKRNEKCFSSKWKNRHEKDYMNLKIAIDIFIKKIIKIFLKFRLLDDLEIKFLLYSISKRFINCDIKDCINT